MTFKGFYIDDTESEEIYAKLLSHKGSLSLSYLPVKEAVEFSGELFDQSPDLIVVDFRLDENSKMISPNKAYKAGPLAQLLRDRACAEPKRDFPIVLISAEQKFEQIYWPDKTAHDLFDTAYVKEGVTQRREGVRAELISLCEGYRDLKSVWDGDRLGIFSLSKDDAHIVEIQEIRTVLESAIAPHVAAKFLLREIIQRPGLLLSDNEIASRLGIGLAYFEKVVPFLQKNHLLYEGIFGGGWRRWWRHKFDLWAEEFFGRRPTGLAGSERAAVLREKAQLDVGAAQSSWNKLTSEKFAFACSSCHRPTEIRHSLSAFDPHAPRFSQRRRICWDCIQTDNYQKFPWLKVDDVDRHFIQMVRDKDRNENEGE